MEKGVAADEAAGGAEFVVVLEDEHVAMGAFGAKQFEDFGEVGVDLFEVGLDGLEVVFD